MSRINSRAKGAAGEREFCNWLFKSFPEIVDKPQRNLEQVRSGGSDIIVPPFCFEVKRVENLDLQLAWKQCKKAARDLDLEPVVAHRRNRHPWSFLVSASHIGCDVGYIQLTESVFISWAENAWKVAG